MKNVKKKFGLPLNLQLFAGNEGDPGQGDPTPPPVTYTEEELQAKLQSETDRRVTEALKKQQAKWEEDFKTKLETEKKEAQRLAKLSAEEQEREKFDKERKEFEAEKLQHQRDALELQTTKILADKKLPTQFASFLITENDADKVKAHIDSFEQTFQSAVQAAVEERLKGSAPKVPGTNDNAPLTWESALQEHYNKK
ncbi:DUF4355 domain-containing protein [Gottfriedia acidiceleris]|uniref:DUF4355 domain-containing protein n=1 Tax=Gottfriedia acidiceleris TaxID=371036 RepID=UPI00101CAD83|nr:DUF4355 domain-containing protein [Gottfriedia acidiceleris]